MGASIFYRPIDPGKYLPVNGPSSFWAAMEEAFGQGESFMLGMSDVPVLRGLRAASQEKESLSLLIEGIENHGDIQVTRSF